MHLIFYIIFLFNHISRVALIGFFFQMLFSASCVIYVLIKNMNFHDFSQVSIEVECIIVFYLSLNSDGIQ